MTSAVQDRQVGHETSSRLVDYEARTRQEAEAFTPRELLSNEIFASDWMQNEDNTAFIFVLFFCGLSFAKEIFAFPLENRSSALAYGRV